MSKYSVLKIKMKYRDNPCLGVEFEKGSYILETGQMVFQASVEDTSHTRNIPEEVKKVLFEAADAARELQKVSCEIEQLVTVKRHKQDFLTTLGDRVKNACGELSKKEFLAAFIAALPESVKSYITNEDLGNGRGYNATIYEWKDVYHIRLEIKSELKSYLSLGDKDWLSYHGEYNVEHKGALTKDAAEKLAKNF